MSYYADIFSPEDVCAPTIEHAKNKFTLTEMKKANDNNFCTVRKIFKKKWKDHYLNSVTISYYKTIPQAGYKIIHAVTGDPLPGLVGTMMEDRYFKVKMASAGESENGTLFYLSPSEYENHQYCHVSQDSVDLWLQKQVNI